MSHVIRQYMKSDKNTPCLKKEILLMSLLISAEATVRTCSSKQLLLNICNILRKILVLVFSCEYCEIFKEQSLFLNTSDDCDCKWLLLFHCNNPFNVTGLFLSQFIQLNFWVILLTLYAPIPQNGQTHSNNSSANC